MRPSPTGRTTLETIFAIDLRRPINATRASHVLHTLANALRDTADTPHP